MVICLERGADLHMAQLMPLPLSVSCFSKIQIGFTFLVPARKRAVKRVCVCVCTVPRVWCGEDDSWWAMAGDSNVDSSRRTQLSVARTHSQQCLSRNATQPPSCRY